MPQRKKTENGKMDFTKDFYTIQEVAEYLNFTEATVRNWEHRDPPLIEFLDIGGSKRVSVKEVLRLSGRSTDILSKR